MIGAPPRERFRLPASRLPGRIGGGLLILAIRAYQLVLRPHLAVQCRFEPSCSEYAAIALSAHGLRRGAALALRRLARCHPWGGSGYDPAPPAVGDR